MMETPSEDLTGLLSKIQTYISENFAPVSFPAHADTHLTTQEVYNKLQKFLPSPFYTAEMVAAWLDAAGFSFVDYGTMNFEWIMKRR